jgi:hypothetical protein
LTSSSPRTSRIPAHLLGGSELRFTLQRHPWWLVSACSDRPPGGDIDSSVQIGMIAMAAGLTPERLALAVSRCTVPAARTRLTRVCRVDPFDSADGLLLESLDEHPPAAAEDAAVQRGFGASSVRQVAARHGWVWLRPWPPGHLRDSEVLDADHVEPASKIGRGLLNPVLTAVCGARVQFRDRCLDTLIAVRAALASGEAPLKVPKSSLRGPGQARAVEQLTGGQCGRHGHSTVDADDRTRAGCRNWVGHGGERDVPPTGSVTGHPIRPGRGQWAADPDPHPADFRDQDPGPSTADLLDTGSLWADDAETFTPPGSAPARAAMATGDVVAACLIEVPQRLLLDGLRSLAQPRERGSRLGQLPCLLNKSRRRRLTLPPHGPLLKGQIPYVPGMRAMQQQPVSLCRAGIQPIARHTSDPNSRCRHFCELTDWTQARHLPVRDVARSPWPVP